jgi:hypothetical protein
MTPDVVRELGGVLTFEQLLGKFDPIANEPHE